MNETRKYIIWSPFPSFSIFSFCPNFFVFLNFFRVLRKLYFERWMQIAIKCIKGPLHLSFSTFSFSQLFRFFLNFFSKVGGTSLWIIHVIGKYTIWAPFSFASQLLFFSTFSFLNFFRLFGKLVFERWTQFAIKYNVYNFSLIYLPLSIFSFFSTFSLFSTFFSFSQLFLASWENLSLNGGCNSLWNK